MEMKQDEGHCLCRLNFSLPFAPVEEQLCPKGRAGERVVGFLPSSPPCQAAQPAGLAGGHQPCPGSAGLVAVSKGPVKCRGEPGVGGGGGCRISYGPLLQHCLVATMSH